VENQSSFDSKRVEIFLRRLGLVTVMSVAAHSLMMSLQRTWRSMGCSVPWIRPLFITIYGPTLLDDSPVDSKP
jgi:hypothetical protein